MSNTFLEELADFIKPAIISKEIENNGKKSTWYFRELTGEEGTNIFGGFSSSDQKQKDETIRTLRNKSVAASACDQEGTRILTEKQAAQLPLTLLNKLHAIVMEHNGLAIKEDDKAKNE